MEPTQVTIRVHETFSKIVDHTGYLVPKGVEEDRYTIMTRQTDGSYNLFTFPVCNIVSVQYHYPLPEPFVQANKIQAQGILADTLKELLAELEKGMLGGQA